MTAQQVAAHIASWACRQGIIPAYGVTVPAAAADDRSLFKDQADGQRAAEILLRAGVSDIVFSEDAQRVTVYHQRRVIQRDIAHLPSSSQGIAVQYRKGSGLVEVDTTMAEMAAGVLPAVGHDGHFCCGCSIGVGPISGAGTLGCLVTDATGTLYGLTNNHVIGGCNHMPAGLPVVAPGPIDMIPGGIDPFCIGHHDRSIPFQVGIPGVVAHHDNTDAALFRVGNSNTVSSLQRGAYDTPTKTTPLADGMTVTKAGRTTGITTGHVVGCAVTATPVSYNLPTVGFSGRAYFEPVFLVEGINGQPFAASGDSGALVVCALADGSLSAVGLVFAVAAERTFVLPLAPILQRFGVTLVGGHNI